MAQVAYNPLSHQRKFHFSDKPYCGLVTGYGGGKSYSLVMKMLRLASQNYGLDGGILAPDLKMFKRDILPLISMIKDENKLRISYNRQDGYIDIPETKNKVWVFHDQDHGESIKGPNLAYFLINEATIISKEAFEATMGRVRLKQARVPQIAFSGTPEGFGYVYKTFVEKQREDTDIIFGSTKENIHLHESFVARMESSYDSLMQQAYIEGKFVNLNGRQAIYSFDRRKHCVPVKYEPEKYPVWISLDFNVNPMAASVMHYTPHLKTKLRVFADIKLKTSDTPQMAQYIKEKYGTNVTIYPDPAGNSRSTKGVNISDISILKEYGFNNIKFKRRIASVRDCLNATNAMFSKDEIQIDPSCVNLITDIEQVNLNDAGILDKTDPERTHWVDGLKDLIDFEFPIVKPLGSSTIQL